MVISSVANLEPFHDEHSCKYHKPDFKESFLGLFIHIFASSSQFFF